METLLQFMLCRPIIKLQVIPVHCTLLGKPFHGWKNIVMILFIKAIINIYKETELPLSEMLLFLLLLILDIKIRILRFIYWKRLQNSIMYGPIIWYGSVYRKCFI